MEVLLLPPSTMAHLQTPTIFLQVEAAACRRKRKKGM